MDTNRPAGNPGAASTALDTGSGVERLGVVVEAGDPKEVLANPQHTRTKLFLSKLL